MDRFLDWLDRGAWIATLQHDWLWAAITAALAVTCVAGMVFIVRHETRHAEQETAIAS